MYRVQMLLKYQHGLERLSGAILTFQELFLGHEHCRVSKVSLFCWHFHFDANSIIGSWNHMKAAQLRKAKSYYSFILPNYAENRNMLKWININ